MSDPHSPIQPAVLRIADLKLYLGLSKTAIHNLAKRDPTFPSRVVLGPRAVAWRRAEIDEWLASRPAARPGDAMPGRGPAVHSNGGGVDPAR